MIFYLIIFTALNILITLVFIRLHKHITDAIEIEFYKQKKDNERQIDMLSKVIGNIMRSKK